MKAETIIVKINAKGGLLEAPTEAGARLDDVILSTGVLLDRPCGGRGTCGKCAVKATGGLTSPTECERENLSQEDLDRGIRLACQARVTGAAEVTLTSGTVFTDKTFSTDVDLALVPGEFGLAIDLGTTTVAAFLTSLDDGRVFAGHATLNRQSTHGAEVMSRLLVEEQRPGVLRELAWQSMVEAAAGLGLEPGVRSRVVKTVAVGNSAMDHLALSTPIGTLIRTPFEPARHDAAVAGPGPLAELFPKLQEVRFPPLPGGFVGSDALACLVYFGAGQAGQGEGATLAIDLGTNGEVMLWRGGRTWVASTAAGPAFEGVNVSRGMRAIPGAIVKMDWDDGPRFATVGGAPAAGLAGSGLLSVVRGLTEQGMIETSGRMADGASSLPLAVDKVDGVKRIVLADDVWLTQVDVRELQKAKSAVCAACEILLERAGLGAHELERVILTGGFGGKLDPGDALALGVLPAVSPGRVLSIANGAGLGAALMLDDSAFERACALAVEAEHVELNLDPSFMDRYVTDMALAAKP